jgi:AcrR family transcriptional regulator
MPVVIFFGFDYVNWHSFIGRRHVSSDTRSKMVAGTINLMCQRGINATSVRDIVAHSGTPRGSITHHFPNGKPQMIEEAIIAAGEEVSEPLAKLLDSCGVIEGLRVFVEQWRRRLEMTQFQESCPVLVAAIEDYVGDGKDGSGRERDVKERLHQTAAQVFAGWQSIIAASLRREGVSTKRACRLAVFIVASIEGTVALCRAARTAQPLAAVWVELEALLKDCIVTRPKRL